MWHCNNGDNLKKEKGLDWKWTQRRIKGSRSIEGQNNRKFSFCE